MAVTNAAKVALKNKEGKYLLPYTNNLPLDDAPTANSGNFVDSGTVAAAISGAVANHNSAASPHAGKFEPAGTAASAVSAHNSAASPHAGKFEPAGAVSAHNNAADAHSGVFSTYLPLTGGTLSGQLISRAGYALAHSDNRLYTAILGGTSINAGGMVVVYGKEHTEGHPGWVVLAATDGTKQFDLVLNPEGDARVGGKNIVRSVNGTTADAAGNVVIDVSAASAVSAHNSATSPHSGKFELTGAVSAHNNAVDAHNGKFADCRFDNISVNDALVNLGFNGNKNSAGYQKFPGGLILQWGPVAAHSNKQLFPTAFPAACLSIAGSGTSSWNRGQRLVIVDRTGFNVNAENAGEANYIAIGY